MTDKTPPSRRVTIKTQRKAIPRGRPCCETGEVLSGMARSAFVTRLTGLYSAPYSGQARAPCVMQPCKNPQGRASLEGV